MTLKATALKIQKLSTDAEIKQNWSLPPPNIFVWILSPTPSHCLLLLHRHQHPDPHWSLLLMLISSVSFVTQSLDLATSVIKTRLELRTQHSDPNLNSDEDQLYNCTVHLYTCTQVNYQIIKCALHAIHALCKLSQWTNFTFCGKRF